MTWFRPRQAVAPWRSHRVELWRSHPVALWRGHRLITVAVALSLAPRLLAMLAFRPALFTRTRSPTWPKARIPPAGQPLTSRIRWFPVSAITRSPAPSSATPHGEANPALPAGPPSPENPKRRW